MRRKFNIAIVLLFLVVIMIGFSLINELSAIKNLVANKKELETDFLGGVQLKSIIAIVIVLVMMLLVLARDYFNKRYVLTLAEQALPTADTIKQKLDEELKREEEEQREVCQSKMDRFESKYNPNLNESELLKLVVDTLEVASGVLFSYNDATLSIQAEFARNSEEEELEAFTDLSDEENLLGRALKHGEMTFINDIPEDYFTIDSGLGAASPKSLVFIPFKAKNDTQKIFELALFKTIEGEYSNLIDFVNKKLKAVEFNAQL